MLRYSVAIIFLSFLLACNNAADKPDVSDIKVAVKLNRFEESFFAADTNNLVASIQNLNKQYPDFYPLFSQQFIGSDEPNIKAFIYYHQFLYDSLKKKYPDLNWLKEDLNEAMRYVKHYFPTYKVPNFFTYIGPFNSPGIVILDNSIGIGLHQYAGKNFSAYSSPEILEMYPQYISRRFDKEYILPNAIKGVVASIYPDSSDGRPLIEQMIEKGKEWYLLDKFLPDINDSLITGFTGDQLKWTTTNEANIWSQITTTEDIYSVDPEVIQRYIGPAPFTNTMSQEYSPGNLGQWIGWQIVKRYVEKNPGLSLEKIIKTPASTIYNEAKYKPK